jgi:hypothetical protein
MEERFEVVTLLLELLPLLLLGGVQRRPGDAGAFGEAMERFNEGIAPRAHHPREDITALSAVETVPESFSDVDLKAEPAATVMGRVPALELIAGPSEQGALSREKIVVNDLIEGVGITDAFREGRIKDTTRCGGFRHEALPRV